jgi:hypothetical protein
VIVSRNPAARRRGGIVSALVLSLLPIWLGGELEAHAASQPIAPPSGTVLVTAGEHGDFSRVVFALGADLPYRAEREPAGLRVVFPGARLGFEYGGVYPARRAHRVVMAEPGSDTDGASFRLRFGCECSTRTFMLDDRLVVDIFDAAPSDSAPSRSGRAAPADEPEVPGAAERRPDLAAGRVAQPQPRPEFLRHVEGLTSRAQSAGSGAAPDGAGFNPDHLERMLAWAIDQGYLTGTPKGGDRPAPTGGREDAPELAAAPPAPTEEPAQPVVVQKAAPGPMLAPAPADAAESAGAQEEAAAPADATGACPDQAALDMAALGGTASFAAELARRQDALSRALAAGQGIAEAQHALAGFYLARLMPQEALQVLRTADGDAPAPTRRWLEAVALVLADRTRPARARPLQAASCRGADVVLWQAVMRAADGPIPRQILESEPIWLRLAAYPSDLRAELALRLAEAGIDAAAPEAIARLLDMVEQAAPAAEVRARALFLRGRLAAARGDFAGARASWEEALHLRGEGALRATLAMLEWDLENDVLDEAAALAALERLAYDWRGHPAQLSIAALTAALHERQGRVALALRAIEEVALGAAGQPAGRAAARLATDLMRRAYADAPSALPIDQLGVFWRYEGFVPPGADGADVRLAFARALIAHGLPNAAIGVLEPLVRDARGAAHEEAIELLAESYLAANRPAGALDLLHAAAQEASASRPGRNLLAARALAALGRFSEAAGVLHGVGGEEAAQLEADYLWKAGLWREATTAFRALLHEQEQGRADPASAVRLAAAAYMAGEPLRLARGHGAGKTGDTQADTSAFAPLPKPDRTAARAVAAQLLDQAASLSRLAERYGLGGAPTP